MTPSCEDCWTRAKSTSAPIAIYRRLLGEHEDNQPVLVHDGVTVYQNDALALLRTMPDESVHAVITDPPYGLSEHKPAVLATTLTAWLNGDREHVPNQRGFMGREWDAFVPPPAVWDECLRVLKPGGHLLCFAGSRTVDLMGLSIRLAGFEMRDEITAWLYGSGFPKSLDVSKAIDKAAGVTREVVGNGKTGAGRTAMNDAPGNGRARDYLAGEYDITAPATDAARQWSGWGTALKPAHEPILVARKPLSGTVAANVLAHGTGGTNIGATRVAGPPSVGGGSRSTALGVMNDDGWQPQTQSVDRSMSAGRWPTNVVLVHHPDCADQCEPGCVVAELDAQSGTKGPNGSIAAGSKGAGRRNNTVFGADEKDRGEWTAYADSGGASRYFPQFRYQAKAPTRERPSVDGVKHPTVKPLELMRWLVRLVTPPGGTVLDPFAGSGTTLQAARDEGLAAIGIESHAPYIALIEKRLTGRDPKPADQDGVA